MEKDRINSNSVADRGGKQSKKVKDIVLESPLIESATLTM